jgi:hypothetical protein
LALVAQVALVLQAIKAATTVHLAALRQSQQVAVVVVHSKTQTAVTVVAVVVAVTA